MKKNTKFAITSILLGVGFSAMTAVGDEWRLLFISGLTIVSALLFAWSIRDGLGFDATLLVFILPVFFTFGVGLFWFLLPSTLIARLPVIILYTIGMNVLVRTANIYVVSAIRKIALARAAGGVGFVLTLFSAFLVYDTIVSLKMPIYSTVGLIFASSIPLYLQGLWISKLSKRLPIKIVLYSLVFSYCTAAISAVLYLWPVSVVVGSLYLTVSMYVFLGLGQARIEARLFKSTVREYLAVGILVFIAITFFTSWRG